MTIPRTQRGIGNAAAGARDGARMNDGLCEHELADSVPPVDLLDAYAALWTALRVACGVVDPPLRSGLSRRSSQKCVEYPAAMWGWESRGRQIAAILLVVGGLIALFVFDESAVFWVLVVLALIVAAFDMWEKSRSSSR